jgi:hypothetical protein
VAPTVLELMGLRVPSAMQAGSLLLKKLPGAKQEMKRVQGGFRGAA